MERQNSHMNEDPRYLTLKGLATTTPLTNTYAYSQPLYGIHGEEPIYVAPSDSSSVISSNYPSSSSRFRSDSLCDYTNYGVIGKPTDQQRSQHTLEPVFFLTPILCPHCNDYIWGSGSIGVQCRECRDCFHSVCSLYAGRVPCERKYDSRTPPPATLLEDTSINDWSCIHVTEWMTVVNLSPYMEIFKSKDIKGPELLSLNKEKLGHMGIKEEFAQDTIIDCISQLQRNGNTSTESLSETELTESHDHKLSDTSFPKLVMCKKCGGYLRGFFHQGQVCEACDIVLHRTCAATGLPPCSGSKSSLIRLLHQSKFGLSLCTQFSGANLDAPPFLQRACHNLMVKAQQNQDLDLYGLFRVPPNELEVAKLRRSCDEDLENVNFSMYKAHVIAHLMKRYLVELPDPVIPSCRYDCLITAARRYQNEDQFVNLIQSALAEIKTHKPHHFATLQFVMVHLLKLCNLQGSRGCHYPPTILIQSLSHILLRPPWENIIELSRNTAAHMRVLDVMLLRIPWGEHVPSFASAPALPPKSHKTSFSQVSEADCTLPSSPQSGHSLYTGAAQFGLQSKAAVCPKIPKDAPQSLRDAPWYWGAITRETATLLMKDTQDGTYLVRDASTGNNEYTLTLRKGGSNKLIKICQRDGKYGFTDPFNSNSVAELVDFYHNENLKAFNESLDIRLLYGVNRNQFGSLEMSTGDLKASMDEVHARYNEKHDEYTKSKERQAKYEIELEHSNESLMSYKLHVDCIQEYLKFNDKMGNEAQPHEEEELRKNRECLEARMLKVREARDEQERDHFALTQRGHNEERQCRSLKEELMVLIHRITELTASLKRKNDSADEDFIDPARLADLDDSSTWLDKTCTRREAEEILSRDKRDGTFLLRMAQSGNYALSICSCGAVQHCIIYKAEGGYGFAEPFLIFKTLEELVLHYSRKSLVMHNELLQTTLKYPALKRGHGAIT